MSYVLLILGLLVLIKGADWLVDGASALAKSLGVSTLVIGLSVVALGTSLPELVVNGISAFQGSTGLALGNVIGSNLANTLLILGIAALIFPPKLARSTIWQEIPFSLLAAVAALVLVSDQMIDGSGVSRLTRSDGIILLLFLSIFVYYLAGMAVKGNAEDEPDAGKVMRKSKAFALVFAGIVGLYFGGSWTVQGAVTIAKSLGMSEFLISATVIAIGTSLPELVTSVRAAMAKQSDLAVGNIVGSNIFNIFGILGVTALIRPVDLPKGAFVDLVFLALVSVFLFVALFLGTKHRLGRVEGGIFVALYVGYMAFIIARG
jgi:cation:H+ antiporter